MIEVKDLELVVKESLPGILITNANQIKAFVEEKIKEYTPENYIGRADLAKDDRAVLNAAVKTLDGKRLELEREFMKPFGEFKTIITDTVKTIKGAAGKLDEIVKEEEEREKTEKRNKIESFFVGLDFKLLPFEEILNPRWLNKTVKDKEWKDDLTTTIERVYTDIKTLEAFPAEDVETLKAFYLSTRDMGKAIAEGERLKAHREALKKEKADRVIREEKQQQKEAVMQLDEEVKQEFTEDKFGGNVNFATGEILDPDPETTVTLRFYGKRSQLVALREYMVAHKIRYEKL